MAVAHAAVLAQGQAFAGQLQLLLALVFAFACFQALGGLGMGTCHGLVAFDVLARVCIQHRLARGRLGRGFGRYRHRLWRAGGRLGLNTHRHRADEGKNCGTGQKTELHGASFGR